MWTAEQLNSLADTQPRRLVPIILDLQTLVRSYIATVRKHELPVFQALIDAIAGRPFIPASAA